MNSSQIQNQVIEHVQNTLTRANSVLIQSDDSDYLQNQLINLERTISGRPKLEVSENAIILLCSEGFSWVDIANIFGISITTLYRRQLEYQQVIVNEVRNILSPLQFQYLQQSVDVTNSDGNYGINKYLEVHNLLGCG
ncbi:2734_t:CDS:2 [Entrophospora sp. SA101]|nr:2734_t:CDS:2 [Entrophospora sp. SA101]